MQSYKMQRGGQVFLTFVLLSGMLLFSFVHPFYLSVSEVKFNENRKQFEISSRLFTDDFEQELRKLQGSMVNLYYTRDQKVTDSLVAKYLFNHFQLQVNGTFVGLNFLGYEKEEEATWCYFESGVVEDPRSVRIINRILYDRGNEQSNIVHLELKGSKKSIKLNEPDSLFYWSL